MNPHVFAGNPLDRGDVYRRDQQWLDEQAHNARSRFLPPFCDGLIKIKHIAPSTDCRALRK